MTAGDAYRLEVGGGARLRADIIDVYVFRRGVPSERDTDGRLQTEFLQLLRRGAPLDGTWQPVMGHVERGESSVACALRELREEVGLAHADPRFLGLYALEQVHPFYLAAIDSIVLSPRFCAEVSRDWAPRLNDEHSDHRWVVQGDAPLRFMWPGQVASCRELIQHVLRPQSLSYAPSWVRVNGLGDSPRPTPRYPGPGTGPRAP
ncbi:MAG: NUDIX domain-containing protein [Phycisphaerae bacterium]|nr:NUDIX domain-containing protein [Phycisphaerae bacterium]